MGDWQAERADKARKWLAGEGDFPRHMQDEVEETYALLYAVAEYGVHVWRRADGSWDLESWGWSTTGEAGEALSSVLSHHLTKLDRDKLAGGLDVALTRAGARPVDLGADQS